MVTHRLGFLACGTPFDHPLDNSDDVFKKSLSTAVIAAVFPAQFIPLCFEIKWPVITPELVDSDFASHRLESSRSGDSVQKHGFLEIARCFIGHRLVEHPFSATHLASQENPPDDCQNDGDREPSDD